VALRLRLLTSLTAWRVRRSLEAVLWDVIGVCSNGTASLYRFQLKYNDFWKLCMLRNHKESGSLWSIFSSPLITFSVSTEVHGVMLMTLTSYSEGSRIESRPDYQHSWPEIFVTLTSTSKRIFKQGFKINHRRFFPYVLFVYLFTVYLKTLWNDEQGNGRRLILRH
jgi:hypothetical protein